MSERCGKFIDHLRKMAEQDSSVRANLRRSLAFPPGAMPRAFPYVEPFLGGADNQARDMFYLAAGLWAAAKQEGAGGLSLGRAARLYAEAKQSDSVEKRFITLLDSDPDQLPNRLRQMCALLQEYRLDFAALLDGLLWWNTPRKRTQTAWARDYYASNPGAGEDKESSQEKEETRA